MTKTQTLPNLASIVYESEEALKEALEARAKLDAAERRAAEAQAKVTAQAADRSRAYLAKLTAEYPAAREIAVATVGDTREALEEAVRSGGDVFGCYMAWVEASIDVWSLEEALAEVRHQAGQPGRTPNAPSFNFAIDVAAIVDRLSMELQDDALQAMRARRAAYMRGEG